MTKVENMFTDGGAYERAVGRWSRLVGDAFIDWLDAPKGLSWLDVGCGNGAFTAQIVSRCAPSAVSGLDPSKAQIEFALLQPDLKRAQFQVGHAEALPFERGSFDVAVMALVISFVPDAAAAVAEMARVVKPGGMIAAYMWDFPNNAAPAGPISSAMSAMDMKMPRPPHPDLASTSALSSIWQAAGLDSVETCAIKIKLEFRDFDDFWESSNLPVGPTGMVIQGMSEVDRTLLKERLRDALTVMPDGRIVYDAVANAVKGLVP